MAIPGSSAVTPSGEATYTIPIQVPPGVAGIEPKLALVYGSQSGNGRMGVGWNLSGLSAITRCPQTLAQDGAWRGVSYSASDRFCWEGKRLVSVTGTYGAEQSTYDTEIASFSKITSFGSARSPGTALDGGPKYFTVKTRDGLLMEFGNTDDSRIAATGTSGSGYIARSWALNKITDVSGNTLTVTYTQDLGSYGPSSISYTSNAVQGLAASSSVSFTYDNSRTDALTGFQAGFPVTNKSSLIAITTSTNSVNVLKYNLEYETSVDTGRSRLQTIRLCNGSGANCLAATRMNFAGPVVAAGPALKKFAATDDPRLLPGPSGEAGWYPIDVNGDGKIGFAHLRVASLDPMMWISNGDGTFTRKVPYSLRSLSTNPLDLGWATPDLNAMAFQTSSGGRGCTRDTPRVAQRMRT